MSLYNDASLLLIPSGYKSGKVYCQKPTNGDGDLTFTRASSATRVNSDGLIEIPRTNLLLRSEEFDNASWEKFRSGTGVVPVVTANYETAPDGSQTADRVQLSLGAGTATGDISYLFQSAATSGATFSIYAKSNTTPCVVFFRNGDDVTTINITTSWQRFELFRSASITGVQFGIRGANYGGATNSSTVDISVWGAQLETGDIATDYIPTTTAAVSVGMTANVPRLDYSQGSCPALLLEPQRTNLKLFSEDMTQTGYFYSNILISSNQTIAPDGVLSADKVIPTTTNGQHTIGLPATPFTTNVSTVTLSVYAKQGEYFNFRLGVNAGGSNGAVFNLSNGTVSNITGGVSASIIDVGNGWYRCIVTGICGSVLQSRILDNSGGTTFAGNGTDGLFLWGWQYEQISGSTDVFYATSYIPTTSTSATRVQEGQKVENIADLIGQTEGTIFIDVNFRVLTAAGFRAYFSLEGSVSGQFSGFNVSNALNGNNVNYAGISYALTEGRHKIVCTYSQANNERKLYVDGVLRATSTHANFLATIDKLSVGCRINSFTSFNTDRPLVGGVNQFALFPILLSNDDCLTLSTL
jgi:hypothetical protein